MQTHVSTAISDLDGSTFMPDANTQTIGRTAFEGGVGVLEGSFSKTQSAFAQVTGRDHTNNPSLNTNTNMLSSGAKAGTNAQAGIASQGIKANIQEARTAFAQDLKEVQASLHAGLEQGAQNIPGMDAGAAERSFKPAPTRSEGGVALGAAVGNAAILGDIYAMSQKKLTPKDECKLAEQACKLTAQVRDTNGNVIGPAAIKNTLNQDFLEQSTPQEKVAIIKDVLRPAEDHDEMIAFDNMERALNKELFLHTANKDMDEIALASTIDTADLDVRDIPQQGDWSNLEVSENSVLYTEMPLPHQFGDMSSANAITFNVPELETARNDESDLKNYIAPPVFEENMVA